MTEIEVALFAGILLVLRSISLYFVIDVILKQLKLWHRVKMSGVKESAHTFRMLLFALALTMLLKNIVPVGIDLVAITSLKGVMLEFASLSDSILVQYFTSNSIFDLIMSGIIWGLYMNAGKYK